MLLTEKLKNYNVILASASPRRRELLQGLEFDFTCKPVDIDESYPPNLEGAQIPLYIADKKADAYLPEMKDNTSCKALALASVSSLSSKAAWLSTWRAFRTSPSSIGVLIYESLL